MPAVEAPPSSPKQHMHTAYPNRNCLGTYYREPVRVYVDGVAKKASCSFSRAVNDLLETVISNGTDEIEEKLGLDVKRSLLLAEERSLRERLKVILRSGAYLKDYAQKLLIGDSKQVSMLKRRVGVYSHIEPKELNIILRILKRREDVVAELLEIEDNLLPAETYPFAVTEDGWTINDVRCPRNGSQRRRQESMTDNQSKKENGGETGNGE